MKSRSNRLPTEAEWEYACRANTTTAFSFGDAVEELRDQAWFGENAELRTHEVGLKKANRWGLHDMHGNVWEWCSDWFESDYYSESDKRDPKGPQTGITRVLRGGSWSDRPLRCRAVYRGWNGASYRYGNVGFRLVFTEE